MKLVNMLLFGIIYMCHCTGCSEELILPKVDEKAEIVVNGHFQPDSIWKIRITKSRVAGSQEPIEVVKSATVNIYEDGMLMEQLTYDQSIFQDRGGYRGILHLPTERRNYEIRVIREGQLTASAADIIPAFSVPSPGISWVEKDFNPAIPRISVKLQTAEGGSYYHYVLLRRSVRWTTDSADTTFQVDPWGEVRTFGNDNNDQIDIRTGLEAYEFAFIEFTGLLVHDVTPNASEINLTFDGGKIELESDGTTGKYSEFQVEVRKVSNHYFEYYRSIYLQINEDTSPLSPKTRIQSNVINGLGTFSAYQSKRSNILSVH